MYRQDRNRTSQLGAPVAGLPDPEIARRDISVEEVRARLAADACVIAPGEMIDIAGLHPEEAGACHFQNESGFYFLTDELPPEAPAPRKKAKPMTTTAPTVEVLVDTVPTSTPVDIFSSLPIPTPALDGGVAQLQALVEGPANLQAVLPKDANGYTVLLGVVAVAGGGAAWKFYNDYSKRKHEENMARIERAPQQDNHQKCDAARAALETRLTDAQTRLEAANIRLEALQQAVSSLQNAPASKVTEFDTSELEDRLAKLEKAAKKVKK